MTARLKGLLAALLTPIKVAPRARAVARIPVPNGNDCNVPEAVKRLITQSLPASKGSSSANVEGFTTVPLGTTPSGMLHSADDFAKFWSEIGDPAPGTTPANQNSQSQLTTAS